MANAAAPLRPWHRTVAVAAAAATTIRPHNCPFSFSDASAAAAAAAATSAFSSLLRAAHGSHVSFLLSNPPQLRPSSHRPPLRRLFSSSTPLFAPAVGLRTQGLRLPGTSQAEDRFSQEESDSGLDPDSPQKSRNERKREARRAVKWGVELANFSPPQIKRILRVASLEKEVFDAIMLVKRLGPDVREGRRRQFNYIGRLLRKVQPDLMDTLIQALKDGDHSKLQALSGPEILAVEDYDEEEEETDCEEVNIEIQTILLYPKTMLILQEDGLMAWFTKIHQSQKKYIQFIMLNLIARNCGSLFARSRQLKNAFLLRKLEMWH